MTYIKNFCNKCKAKLKLSTSLSSNKKESKGDIGLISDLLHADCKPLVFQGQTIDVVPKEGCAVEGTLVAQLFIRSNDGKFCFLFTHEFKEEDMDENGILWVYENLKFKGMEFVSNTLKLYFKETNYVPPRNHIRNNATFINVTDDGFYLRAKALTNRLISMVADKERVKYIPDSSDLPDDICVVKFKK